jgi:hypothetical protein
MARTGRVRTLAWLAVVVLVYLAVYSVAWLVG